MDLEHLEEIRLVELEQFVRLIRKEKGTSAGRPEVSILEIGAGAGHQAKQLARLGFDVEAIDLPTSNYAKDQVWPVTTYDGHSIPFEDDRFDVVFSSNVLEHIPHLGRFHREMQRVLHPNGVAFHIVPTASWRFWRTLAHLPAQLIELIRYCALAIPSRRKRGIPDAGGRPSPGPRIEGPSLGRRILRTLVPLRHGETGTTLTELYYFSRFHWRSVFRKGGWKLAGEWRNRLFYSGCALLGTRLSPHTRRVLSLFLGSSCHLFLLVQQEQQFGDTTIRGHNT